MNRRVVTAGLLLLTLVAVGSWWLRQGEERGVERAGPAATFPDYLMERFTATSMDESGQPEHRLSASAMVHYSDDTTDLDEPRLTLFREGAPPWYIVAESGHVGPGGELVTLRGDVRMTRPSDDEGSLQLVTDVMYIRPESKYAETDAPVTVTEPSSTVQAVGMQAFLEEERVVLLSEVHGTYVPEPD